MQFPDIFAFEQTEREHCSCNIEQRYSFHKSEQSVITQFSQMDVSEFEHDFAKHLRAAASSSSSYRGVTQSIAAAKLFWW